MIFNPQKLSPESGMLLVAGANLMDPNFSRSIILLCEHQYDGSFGLVLNQPTALRLSNIMKNLSGWDARLFRGGPVQENTLHFIHKRQDIDIGSHEIFPGLYWGGEFDALGEHLTSKRIMIEDVRFFLGYSGWGEGQLDSEIKRDSWYLKRANADLIFHEDSRNHWRNTFRTMGPEYAILTNFPDDPRFN